MMMCLGTFVFSLPTLVYQQLQRQMQWRHAATERVGARAASQFLGPGEESIEMSGLLAPELTGTLVSLDVLRDMADAGRPYALVDGTGSVFGAYVILSINQTQSLFYQDGTPRRIEFQLSLRRVPDDALAEAAVDSA